MQRKKFIAGLFTAAALPVVGQSSSILSNWPLEPADKEGGKSIKIPPYLKSGDCIAITCPAGFITLKDIQPAKLKLKEWGFEIKIGDTVGKKDFTLGGTDAERLQDFQQLLDDKSVKAILCARGGYGVLRIIDNIDFTQFKKTPKWIIGFSDITVLHSHIHANFGIATLHSKMCNSFPFDWSKAEPIQIETIHSIQKTLLGEQLQYEALPNEKNRNGEAKGQLIGGNLKTIESLAGSKSDIHTAGKILFVEDTGEYLYSIDRMFWNLQRSGKLSNLAGLIIGGFKVKAADTPEEEFGKNLYDIVLEKTKNYHYPICFDFPVGHQKNNFALKCGITHQLSVTASKVSLAEI
jgi:muramoyltetrapeptide carboxypeptidase